MKTLKIMMIVILSASPAMAWAASHETCKTYSTLAEYIMKSRQYGDPEAKVIDKMHEIFPDDTSSGAKTAEMLVLAAYKKPRFGTEKFQKREITEFSNAAYSDCRDN